MYNDAYSEIVDGKKNKNTYNICSKTLVLICIQIEISRWIFFTQADAVSY